MTESEFASSARNRQAGLCPTLMVQGTASSVGKSLLVAGLCRHFARRGLSVAPFKSQNMALNAFVTPEGHEIGRAQALQARAAGLLPHVDMNPVLLKPEADARAQVVLMGQPLARLEAVDYDSRKREFGGIIAGCLERLRRAHDLVLIEGAGSPAEINLRSRDIANMFVAELADAPVLLVADIDRGGALAALVGTLALLDDHERARVKGLLLNKFRGDRTLLEPALPMLEARAERKVVGVMPYLKQLRLPDEDSVALEARGPQKARADQLSVVVVATPLLSNHDDFLPLETEPSLAVSWARKPAELLGADLIVLGGSKSTLADLRWLRQQGLAQAIAEAAAAGTAVLGICGGYQMLGREIVDRAAVEGQGGQAQGLGLLEVNTEFGAGKVTRQLGFRPEASLLTDGQSFDQECRGYQIHMGRVQPRPGVRPLFFTDAGPEGAQSEDGRIMGTLCHGLFDDDRLRQHLIDALARHRGGSVVSERARYRPDAELDRLADAVGEAIDARWLAAVTHTPCSDCRNDQESP
ncbi:MAG: cobyric acid synthase [Myxococcales bacterium]|nr:cobyric acid synthase [Myxococcales bacterium]